MMNFAYFASRARNFKEHRHLRRSMQFGAITQRMYIDRKRHECFPTDVLANASRASRMCRMQLAFTELAGNSMSMLLHSCFHKCIRNVKHTIRAVYSRRKLGERECWLNKLYFSDIFTVAFPGLYGHHKFIIFLMTWLTFDFIRGTLSD